MAIQEDLQQIARQERALRFARFDEEAAWALGVSLRESGMLHGSPMVVDVRRFGQPLFYAALPGSKPENADWARRKANTVERFLRSSYAIGLELKAGNTGLTERYGLPEADFAAHGGGFPLAVAGGEVVGSVTVSGLPQREDHSLVVRAVCALLGKSYEALALPGA